MSDKTKRFILDPDQSALLIIDVQKGLFSRPKPIHNADELIQNINSLIDQWRAAGGMIVFVQHSNNKLLVKYSRDWQLHPDLKINGADLVIHKVHGNAFEETELNEILKSRGIQTMVVTGLVTQGCVRATCIGAHDLGYRVILVEDGHSNYSKDAEKIVKEWNQRLSDGYVELTTTESISLGE
jgi:nicotinamidase-related amidase